MGFKMLKLKFRWTDYKNMKEAIDAAVAEIQDVTIIKYLDQNRQVVEISGNQFLCDIQKYGSALIRMNLQDKHVALIGKNSYEYLAILFACLYTGPVSVLLSKDYTTEEVKQYCKLTDVDAILFSSEQEEKLVDQGIEAQLISMQKSECPEINSLSVEKDKNLVEITNSTGWDDLINMLLTSGTTGLSKAVMHSNRSLMSSVVDPHMDDAFESVMVLFPFHHVAGYCLALECFFAGEQICLGEDPTRITRYMDKLKPEFLFVVPALLQVICQKLKNKTVEELGWKLKCIGCGGAKAIVNDFKLLFDRNIKVFQSYASSECGGRGISAFMNYDNIDTIGKPASMVDVKIIDDELVFSGPMICMGYYNNPDETAATFKDGCYYTGDLARQDEDGNYYLTGRKKNLIILSNGENVSPEEIENVFYEYPEVLEILVREEGNVIGAVIYPDYSECSTDAEKEAVKERVRNLVKGYNDETVTYKQIHKVEVTEGPLPKTSTNKIKRTI